MAFCAERFNIEFSLFFALCEQVDEVGAGGVGGGIALGDVRPVQDKVSSVGGNYDIARTKVAVTYFVVAGHSVEVCLEFVLCHWVEVAL